MEKSLIPKPEVVGITSSATIAILSDVIHEWKNTDPRAVEAISPLLENHVGNVTPSMLIVISGYLTWTLLSIANSGLAKNGKKSINPETMEKLEKIVPAILVMTAIAANVWIELQNPCLSEFTGDVAAGALGALLAVGLINLPRQIDRLRNKQTTPPSSKV